MAVQVTYLPVTVAYDEMMGSPTETSAQTDFQATRILLCNWADRLLLADQMLTGYLVNLGQDCDGNSVVSRMGQLYPWRNGVYADHCEIAPYRGMAPSAANGNPILAGYQLAQVTVHHRPFAFEANTGTLLAEESIELSTQYRQVSGRNLWFKSGSNPYRPLKHEETPTKMVKTLEWTLTLRQLLNVPSCWFTAGGCVNSAQVTSPQLNRTFEVESLLYHGPRCQRVTGENSGFFWNVTLHFSHLFDPFTMTSGVSGISWNNVMRGAEPQDGFTSGQFQPVYAASSPSTTQPPQPGGTVSQYMMYNAVDFVSTFLL